MPSAQNIVLNDGQATPVAHTFVPLSVGTDQATLVCRDTGNTAAGAYRLQLGLDPARTSRPTNRVRYNFHMPIEQSVDGVDVVTHTARFFGELVVPEAMTLADRKNLAAFVQNALANSIVKGYVEDLEPMWG